MKSLISFLPKSIQKRMFRSKIDTQKIFDHYDHKDITVKLAETYEEYRKAFELLHDCYVKKGLMEPHPSNLRCSVHSFLPHNHVVVAVNGKGEVVGTISIIKDNPLYLPAESVYKKEVVDVRSKEGRELAEISALSISPEYREQSHTIQFMLNKFTYNYCTRVLFSNTMVIAVHPNAEVYYSALFDFKPLGKVVSYDFVKGALARFLYMDTSGDFERNVWENLYKKKKNSFFDYILNQDDKRLLLPNYRSEDIHTIDKNVAIKLIKESHFNLDNLNRMELSYVISSLNLNAEDLKFLGLSGMEVISDYRFQVKIMAKGQISSQDYIFKIHNLSTQGAFVEFDDVEKIDANLEGDIQFNWKGNDFFTRFKIVWLNKGISKKLPRGIGIQFIDNKINFFDEEIRYKKRIDSAS